MVETNIVLIVSNFAFLLGLGVLVTNILKKYNIPDGFFLIMLGFLLGPTIMGNPIFSEYMLPHVNVDNMGTVPDFFRMLALILVVFTGTFNLGLKAFKRFSTVALNLAIVVVALNTLVMGLVAQFVFGLEPIPAFLLSAILSGTGAAVVSAFEKSLKQAKRSITILKVESILNTPFSVILPILFLDLIMLSATSAETVNPFQYISEFWLLIVAGAGTGLIVGLGIAKLFKHMLKEYTTILMFAMALVTFALAEAVGGSGILAVAVCGLVASEVIFSDREEVRVFEDQLTELFRIAVFTLLGAQVALTLTGNQFVLSMIFVALMILVRPIFVLPMLGKEKKDFSRKDILVMSFIAPRGLSAAAMAPIVALSIANLGLGMVNIGGEMIELDKFIIQVIFLTILVTMLFSTVFAKIASMGRFNPKTPKQKKKHQQKEFDEETIEKAESDDKMGLFDIPKE